MKGEGPVNMHESPEVKVTDRVTDHRRVRLAWLFALTLPAAFVAWVGCGGDDKSGSSNLLEADPGGTYGAEVVVSVKGRGRVTASLPGLECPSDCFARFVFADKTKAGSAAGVVLKAEATPGSNFVGFTFDTVNLGTGGRGPETCNPLTRASSQPPAPPTGDEVVLPFGETAGTPPAGASCSGTNNVPLAYVVTATFETPEIPEAGPPDAGEDAGPPPGDPVFDPPASGTVTGKEIGYAGGYLYWRFDVAGQSGIAYGSPSSFPQTPTAIVSPSNQVTKFDVSPYAVVYQRSNGTLNVISAGSTFSTSLSGAPTCENVASDSSYAYCLTSTGLLYSWTLGGSGPTALHSGLPTGNDKFGVNSSYLYFVDDPSGTTGTAAIKYASKTGTPDAGVPTLTTLASGQTNPMQLVVSSSYAGWINYDAQNDVGTLQRSFYSSGPASTLITATNGLRLAASDPSTSSYFYGGVVPTGTILKATGGTPVELATGIKGLGGITADSSYVYWTAGDGRVYRKSKF